MSKDGVSERLTIIAMASQSTARIVQKATKATSASMGCALADVHVDCAAYRALGLSIEGGMRSGRNLDDSAYHVGKAERREYYEKEKLHR